MLRILDFAYLVVAEIEVPQVTQAVEAFDTRNPVVVQGEEFKLDEIGET